MVLMTVGLGLSGAARAEAGQLGALISPGALSTPHAELEGVRQCQNCHEAGQRVSATRCLACHKPVAERIAAKRGVHRAVTNDCVACHVEHMGAKAELRPFDTRGFDHRRDASYPLDGKHAGVASDCGSCHKERSFLTASTSCQSCHEDVHKGSLGATCTECHSASVAFEDAKTRFDHSKAAFPLVGAHQKPQCERCHTANTFRVAKFATCSDCHADPHRPAQGADCTACHTSNSWRTSRVNHRRTDYPLGGRHADVVCAKCHTGPAVSATLVFDTCASCHTDPHRGTFQQDCQACHSERGFDEAPFDHTTTGFVLAGKHASATCEQCHDRAGASALPGRRALETTPGARVRVVDTGRASTSLDFRGLTRACGSCHQDAHEGELGAGCETCHGDTSFALSAYTHRRITEFLDGEHTRVGCDGCHKADPVTGPLRTGAPVSTVRYTAATTTCVSCHQDVHLGQVGTACESCHTLQRPKFAVSSFPHERTSFPLTGAHASAACHDCHKAETARFPAAFGTATRLTGLGETCTSCHADVHLGQVGAQCEQCHATATFHLDRYEHRNATASQKAFFVGPHRTAACDRCHVPATGQFAGRTGTAVVYRIETRCAGCHTDVHRGQLGDQCADCHRLSAARPVIPDPKAGLDLAAAARDAAEATRGRQRARFAGGRP